MSEELRPEDPEDLARTAKNASAMAAAAADCARKAAERAAQYAEQVFDSLPMTTAEALGRYRRELLSEGFSGQMADELVRDLACRNLHERGVMVNVKDESHAEAIDKLEQRIAVARERQQRHWRDTDAEIAKAQAEIKKLLPKVGGAAHAVG